MAALPFPAPSLDASILEAIRMALLSVAHPSAHVMERILAGFPPAQGKEEEAIDISPQDALGIFAALIKIEWDRSRAEFGGIPIRSLVAAWKAVVLPVLDR